MTFSANGLRAAQPTARRAIMVAVVLWLVLVAVLGALAWLLTAACAIGWRGAGPVVSFCPVAPAAAVVPDTDALARELARGDALRRQLEALQLQIVAAPFCPPTAQGPEVAARPLDPGNTGVPDIIARDPSTDGSAAPELVGPDERTGLDTPEAPPIDIPDDAWSDQDLAFLEGCWQLISDYRLSSVETGEVFGVEAWEMCFEAVDAASGAPDTVEGAQSLVFETGTACGSRVEARFDQHGQLIITDESNVGCEDGTAILRRIMVCQRRSDGTAACETRTIDTGGRSSVLFQR